MSTNSIIASASEAIPAPADEFVPVPPPLPTEKRSRSRTKQRQAASPPPVTAAKVTEAESLAPVARWGVPASLASLVVHLLLTILLAIGTIPLRISEPPRVVEGAFVTEDVLPLQTEVVELKLDQLPEMNLAAVVGASLEAADIGSAAAALPAQAGAFASSELNLGGVRDVGEIFSPRGHGLQAVDDGKGIAKFFGVEAQGKRFCFIVDSSNSMRGKKFEEACRELMYSIRNLTPDQSFYVIFFDQDMERMTFAPHTQPEDTFARATIPNIKLLDAWVKSVKNQLKTNPSESVRFAVKQLVPDALFLLSDGRFTDRGSTVRWLKDNNWLDNPIDGRRPRVVIHTIAFHDKDGEETLRDIAKTYNGTFRFVAADGKK